MKPWYLYIIRCSNNSLYTGTTTDAARRFEEHSGKGTKGAKYTRTHRPLTLVFSKKIAKTRGDALKIELAVKRLGKAGKEKIVATRKLPVSITARIRAKSSGAKGLK